MLIVLLFIPLLAAQNHFKQKDKIKDVTVEINLTQRNISKPINKICPVKDEIVNDNAPAVIYKNKIIGFCCPGCDDVFLKNPEIYEAKLNLKDN